MVARWFVCEGAEERQRWEGLSGRWIRKTKKKKGSSGFKSARASKLVARRWGVVVVVVGVKSVHNLDLEAERNKKRTAHRTFGG